MKGYAWYRLTHDNAGDRYGWIIGKEGNNSEFIVYLRGYSRDRFLAAAEMIISTATDPDHFLVINPAGKGTAYRLTNVYHAAKHSGFKSIEKAFCFA